jgi:DNA-binding IclR family transcriptional regulator
VHRLLAALGKKGLVERLEGGRYRPGSALVALGLGVLDREPIVAAARPIINAEAADLGETFFIVAAHSRELIVLDKAEGRGFLRASPQVGEQVPIHATAVGKLYLAFGPDQVELDPELHSFTPSTLTDSEHLRVEVEATRERGWARNRDEWVQGLGVLAAPVRVARRMLGAVAFASASPRLDELGMDEVSMRVVAAAHRIEERLTLPASPAV